MSVHTGLHEHEVTWGCLALRGRRTVTPCSRWAVCGSGLPRWHHTAGTATLWSIAMCTVLWTGASPSLLMPANWWNAVWGLQQSWLIFCYFSAKSTVTLMIFVLHLRCSISDKQGLQQSMVPLSRSQTGWWQCPSGVSGGPTVRLREILPSLKQRHPGVVHWESALLAPDKHCKSQSPAWGERNTHSVFQPKMNNSIDLVKNVPAVVSAEIKPSNTQFGRRKDQSLTVVTGNTIQPSRSDECTLGKCSLKLNDNYVEILILENSDFKQLFYTQALPTNSSIKVLPKMIYGIHWFPSIDMSAAHTDVSVCT